MFKTSVISYMSFLFWVAAEQEAASGEVNILLSFVY